MNMIARSITIATPDFACLWGAAITMDAYLMNTLLYKHLPSFTALLEPGHGKIPTISDLKPFGSKCYVHIREEEHCSGNQHLQCVRNAILVRNTSSAKDYRVFIFEDEYVFTTQDLTILKKTSSQIGTTLR
jgi:hypothetical protein